MGRVRVAAALCRVCRAVRLAVCRAVCRAVVVVVVVVVVVGGLLLVDGRWLLFVG